MFSPADSIVGRWFRSRSDDSRQAESTYIVVAGLSTIALLLVHLVVWSSLRPDSLIVAAGIEAVFVAAYVLMTFVGRRPAIFVVAEPPAMIIRQGDRELVIPFEDVESIDRIDGRTFHRHYRRYAETRVFVNRVRDELLLLTWNGVPVVLGLGEEQMESVEHLFERLAPIGHASSHVDAA